MLDKNDVKRCYFCDFKGTIHNHHIIWKTKGGDDSTDNIIQLCPNHHSLIHNDDYELLLRDKKFILILKKDVKIRCKNKNLYLTVFKLIKSGLNPTQIADRLNMSRQAISPYIKRLKASGLIKKIGYGIWELNKKDTGGRSEEIINPSDFSNSIRGHSFRWIINIPRISNWNNRKEFLIREKVVFKDLPKNQFFVFKNKTVQLCDDKIVVYDPVSRSYFGGSANESYRLAFYELLSFLVSLEGFLRVSLRFRGEFVVGVSFPHFARVKDALAVQCNKDGRKLLVKIDEFNRFLIDNSFNFDEAEVQGRDGVRLMDDVYVRSIRELFDSGKTPMDLFGEVERQLLVSVNMQGVYNENIKKHLEVLDEIKKAIKDLKR